MIFGEVMRGLASTNKASHLARDSAAGEEIRYD
jgi:hypothetical protein